MLCVSGCSGGSGGSGGSGSRPGPALGFGGSSMVVGSSPVCLLVYWVQSGCSDVKNNNNSNDNNSNNNGIMGKQVQVR